MITFTVSELKIYSTRDVNYKFAVLEMNNEECVAYVKECGANIKILMCLTLRSNATIPHLQTTIVNISIILSIGLLAGSPKISIDLQEDRSYVDTESTRNRTKQHIQTPRKNVSPPRATTALSLAILGGEG